MKSTQIKPKSVRNISGRWIILLDGTLVTIKQWQQIYGVDSDKIGEYFSLNEPVFTNTNYCISELTIRVADLWREISGTPKRINHMYRTTTQGKDMKQRGLPVADTSPHMFGMAMDVDTKTKQETRREVENLRKAAKQLGIKIRVGYRKYLTMGMTFIHFDVCPEYFCPGKPFHHINHSRFWEMTNTW